MLLVVELLGRPDDLLVLREARVPLARPAAQDPVEVVESPAVRPTVELPRGTLLAVGCQVPLAERCRAVAVVAEDPGQGRAVPWEGGSVAGNPPANSPIDPNPIAWLFRPLSSDARVGEHSAVTWNRLYRSPTSAIRV